MPLDLPEAQAPVTKLPDGIALQANEPFAPHDWDRIFLHLASADFEIDTATMPRRIAGGLANLNYLLRLASGGWVVLRRPPPGPLPPGAHDMAREHRILKDLWVQMPLAPRSYHLCTDLAVAGVQFQLLEFRPGVAVRGDLLAPFADTPATGQALSQLLVGGLAQLHSVDPAAAGLGSLGKPENFMARGARGWIDRARRVCPARNAVVVNTLAAWLERYTTSLAGEVALLHNDFKLDNMLLNPQTMAPVAVLDWDMGTRGDALFDLATLLSYWSEGSDPHCMQALAQMPTARAGFMSREQAAAAYSQVSGRALADFKVYRVLAMFKLGVVFHQLHSRFLSGETQDPRFAGFGELADGLLDFTRDVAADKYF